MNKKISDKDKKDWENFLSNKEKVLDKEIYFKNSTNKETVKKIDLHGLSLENANRTIDGFINKNDLDQLDFIKIDTDGNELSVLRGAKETLIAFRPVIVFEITTYLLDEKQQSFSDDFLDLLTPIGYGVFDSVSGRRITNENIRQIVPPGGSIDLVAVQLDSRD